MIRASHEQFLISFKLLALVTFSIDRHTVVQIQSNCAVELVQS